MTLIPLEVVPSQQFSITLEDQSCIIKLYQRGGYMYMDLTADAVVVFQGAICLTDAIMPQYVSNKFNSFLAFIDNTGLGGIPNWEELGTRYYLIHMTADEFFTLGTE